MAAFTLADLAAIIDERAGTASAESYTAKLLAGGIPRAARKFGEESLEVILAAMSGDKAGLTAEAADVAYHLLVLLKAAGVPLADVMAELERRTSQGGLAEKAARK
jgi:phosphoribosyl-ATP pyrophosphohydrolase